MGAAASTGDIRVFITQPEKYAKHKLPFDASRVNHDLDYMRSGGNQLLEIMQKEFPLELIEKYQRDLQINDNQLELLKLWLKHKTIVGRVQKERGFTDPGHAKAFFYQGKGLLGRLYRAIDTEPIFLTENVIESRYSFVTYDVMRAEDNLLLISRPYKLFWSSVFTEDKPAEYILHYYGYTYHGGMWEFKGENHEHTLEMRDAYELFHKMTRVN